MTRILAPYGTAERVFYGVIGFVVVIAVWEAAVQGGILARALLSQPSRIWAVAMVDFGSGVLWNHMWVSFQEFWIGFAVGFSVPTAIFLIGMLVLLRNSPLEKESGS